MFLKIVFCWTLLSLTTTAEKDFNPLGGTRHIDKIKNRINLLENSLTFEYTNFSNFASPTFALLHRGRALDNLTLPESSNRSRDNDASYSSLPLSLTDVNSSRSDIGESKQPEATRHYCNDYYRDCGKLQLTRFKRVTGGQNSSLGRVPWQVALFKRIPGSVASRLMCGGALLSNKWIITAGHCVDDVPTKRLRVVLGVNDIKNISEKKLRQIYKVTRKMIHPEYDNVDYRNDIALLRVYGSVRFDWHVVPICLPSQDLNVTGRTATISGWGRTVHENKKSKQPILNEVDIKVIQNDVCEKWFSEAGNDDTPIDDVYLCAGSEKGVKDSCQGDSGGPLTTSVDERRVLIGIVSWGYGCGKEFSPGLYTNVKKFVPWIMKVTN